MEPTPTLSLVALLFSLAALFGFINYRFLRLPSSTGIMVVALFASMCGLGLNLAFPALDLPDRSQHLLGTKDLPQTLLNGALCFLLFAGALGVDMAALWNRKSTVFFLATFGVLIATGLFGLGIWLIFGWAGTIVPLAWCIVLGALLAPTDPVAVVGLLARLGLSKNLQAVMAGESLFNDGVGVVVFGSALMVASNGGGLEPGRIGLEFLWEVGGGLMLGGALGWIAYLMIRPVDDYPLEIMISLALAAATYVLAGLLGTSGPVGVVAAGLLIGHKAKNHAMSETTRHHLSLFWSVIDELLNALLFLLLGFEMLALSFDKRVLAAALLAIPLALAVRAISVVLAVSWLHLRNPERWPGIVALTWGGLRGGISVALALSLPATPWRDDILFVCYAVVVFTILVQGLTMGPVMERVSRQPGA